MRNNINKLMFSILIVIAIVVTEIPYNILANDKNVDIHIETSLQDINEIREGTWGTCKWRFVDGLLEIY